MKLSIWKEGQSSQLITDHQMGLRAGLHPGGHLLYQQRGCSEPGMGTRAEKMEPSPWGRAEASVKDALPWGVTARLQVPQGSQELPGGAESTASRPSSDVGNSVRLEPIGRM